MVERVKLKGRPDWKRLPIVVAVVVVLTGLGTRMSPKNGTEKGDANQIVIDDKGGVGSPGGRRGLMRSQSGSKSAVLLGPALRRGSEGGDVGKVAGIVDGCGRVRVRGIDNNRIQKGLARDPNLGPFPLS